MKAEVIFKCGQLEGCLNISGGITFKQLNILDGFHNTCTKCAAHKKSEPLKIVRLCCGGRIPFTHVTMF